MEAKTLDEYFQIQDVVEDKVRDTVEEYGEDAVKFLSLVTQYLPAKDKLEDPIRTLDVGCNTGYNVDLLQEKYGHAIGVDINERHINRAQELGRNCFLADMHLLDTVFPPSYFNLIFAKDVLEHSYNPDKVLKILYGLLKEDGYLVSFIPMDGGAHPQIVLDIKTGNPAHIWKTNYQDCEERFRRAGFLNIEIHRHSVQKDIGHPRPIGDDIGIIVARKYL